MRDFSIVQRLILYIMEISNGIFLKQRGVRDNGAQFNGRPTRTKTPVCGKHIEYVDDTGFTADGDFRDGVLYHAGMVLYRENVQ